MAIRYWDGNGPHYGRSNSGRDRAENGIWSTSAKNWALDGSSDRGEMTGSEDWSNVLFNPDLQQTYQAWVNGDTPYFAGAIGPISISNNVSVTDFIVGQEIQSNVYIIYKDRYINSINQEIIEFFNFFGSPYPDPPTVVSPNPDPPPDYFWNGPIERSVHGLNSQGTVGTSQIITFNNGTASLNNNCKIDIQHYVPIRTSKVVINSKLVGTTWYKDGAGTLELTNGSNTARLTSILSGTVIPKVSGALGQTATTIDLYGQLFLDNFYDLNIGVNIYDASYRTEALYNSSPLNPATSTGFFEITSGSCGLKEITIVGNMGSRAVIDIKKDASLYVKDIHIGGGATQLEVIGDGNLTVENIYFDEDNSDVDIFAFTGRGNLVITNNIVGSSSKKFIFSSHKNEKIFFNELNFGCGAFCDLEFGERLFGNINTSELKLSKQTDFYGTIDLRKGKFYIEHENAVRNASVYNHNNAQIIIDIKTGAQEPTVLGNLYLLSKGTSGVTFQGRASKYPLTILNTGSLTINNLYAYYENKGYNSNDFNAVYGFYSGDGTTNIRGGDVVIDVPNHSSNKYLKINNLYAKDVDGNAGHKPAIYFASSDGEFTINNVLDVSLAHIKDINLQSGRIKFTNSGENTEFDNLYLNGAFDAQNVSGTVYFGYTGSAYTNYTFNINNESRCTINVPTSHTASLTGYLQSFYRVVTKIGNGKLVLAGSGSGYPYNSDVYNYCFNNTTYPQDSIIRTLDIKQGILEGSSSFEQYSTASHDIFTSWYPTYSTELNWDNLLTNTTTLLSDSNQKISNLNFHRRTNGTKKIGLDNISGKRTTINVFSGSTLEISNLNLSVNSLNNYGTIKNTSNFTASILIGYGKELIRETSYFGSGSYFYYELNDDSLEGYTDEYELIFRPELRKYIKKKINVKNDYFFSSFGFCSFTTSYATCFKDIPSPTNTGILVSVPLLPGDDGYTDCKLGTIIRRARENFLQKEYYSIRSANNVKDSNISGILSGNIQIVTSNRSLSNLKYNPTINGSFGGIILQNAYTNIDNYSGLGTKLISATTEGSSYNSFGAELNFNSATGALTNDIALDGDTMLSFNYDNTNSSTVIGNIYVYGYRERERNLLGFSSPNAYNYYSLTNLTKLYPSITNNSSYNSNKYLNLYGKLLTNFNSEVDFYRCNIKLYSTASNVSKINLYDSAITLENNNSLPNCTLTVIKDSYLNLNSYSQSLFSITKYDKGYYDLETCEWINASNNAVVIVYNTSTTASQLTLDSFNSEAVRFGLANSTNRKIDLILTNGGTGNNVNGGAVNTFTSNGNFISNKYTIGSTNGFYINGNLIVRNKLTAVGTIYANNILFEFNNASINSTGVISVTGSNATIFASGNAEITGTLVVSNTSFLRFQK